MFRNYLNLYSKYEAESENSRNFEILFIKFYRFNSKKLECQLLFLMYLRHLVLYHSITTFRYILFKCFITSYNFCTSIIKLIDIKTQCIKL